MQDGPQLHDDEALAAAVARKRYFSRDVTRSSKRRANGGGVCFLDAAGLQQLLFDVLFEEQQLSLLPVFSACVAALSLPHLQSVHVQLVHLQVLDPHLPNVLWV